MKLIIRYLGIFIIALSTPLTQASDNESKFKVKLHSLNGSGVTGEAKIKIKHGKTLKIELEVKGLEPGKLHPQHIHGLTDLNKNATCPNISADTNADGIISVGEGLPFYGPIVLALPPFDLVAANGELEYEAKFRINPSSIQPLEKRTIVVHGMTVNGVYIPSLPVACGQIVLKKND